MIQGKLCCKKPSCSIWQSQVIFTGTLHASNVDVERNNQTSLDSIQAKAIPLTLFEMRLKNRSNHLQKPQSHTLPLLLHLRITFTDYHILRAWNSTNILTKKKRDSTNMTRGVKWREERNIPIIHNSSQLIWMAPKIAKRQNSQCASHYWITSGIKKKHHYLHFFLFY